MDEQTHRAPAKRTARNKPSNRLWKPGRGPGGSSNEGEIMNSPKRLARLAGVFYLMVAITGGFSEGFVDLKMRVAGNAAATAANVLADPGLVRLSVVSHLLDATFFMLTAMVLYFLLRHAHEGVARVMLVFVVLAAGI